jgi:Na+-transporting methylmalonyl-CoA/oxaloacetate decarboxylase gamma subunit
MSWVAEMHVAGAGLTSVFAVLILLYVSMVAMSALIGKGESGKTEPPTNEELKK